MHPAHIPLVAEVQTILFYRSGNLRPCGRFLRNHHRSRITTKDQRINMLKELDCFKILVATINVRNPLTVLLAIIKIEHRSNRIHTKSVNMIIFNPHECTADQEILNLILAVIEDLGSPIRMLSLARICIFVCRCSVKIHKSMCILREMRRYPVKNDTNLLLMALIDQVSKILRRSVTGGRCIITGYLIAPRSIERILRDSHQFNVCVSHLLDI